MLNLMIENSGKRAILHCSGNLVAGQESTLLNTIESLESCHIVVLVLDLTGVSGIDARGLGALVGVKRWAFDAGVRLQLVPSNAVQELLELTRLSSEFELCSPRTFPVYPPRINGIAGAAADE